MNCDSTNLIYVLICMGCDKYYIGETGDKLRNRTRVHRQGVQNNTSLFVDQHISECAINMTPMFKIFPFYSMLPNSTKTDRLVKEEYFRKKFKADFNR